MVNPWRALFLRALAVFEILEFGDGRQAFQPNVDREFAKTAVDGVNFILSTRNLSLRALNKTREAYHP